MGELLFKQGFTNVDGSDANERYVRYCQNSGWYKNTYTMLHGLPRGFQPQITEDQLSTVPEHLQSRYDCVIGSGVFDEGRISSNGIIDAYEMLKEGGHLVATLKQ